MTDVNAVPPASVPTPTVAGNTESGMPACKVIEGRAACPTCNGPSHERDEVLDALTEIEAQEISVSPNECLKVCWCPVCRRSCCCERGTPSDRPSSLPDPEAEDAESCRRRHDTRGG